ncbi:exodeoxyribonuclease VII large subunit [uncultured Anaerovibrio sp.]|uniref:exodeoxyribonuclease VII large subunit n=1 Tax=uncultured Anaerovibrio sp. TaxID=361586 RepID=UPI002618AEC4|nr:exodeoxyribonuclease VII large subunit [uncultured Anaerovibrio sp.]
MAVVRSVSEITKYIAGLIKNDLALHNVTIRGQISNFKQYSSGHCYFDLKDKESILKCVIWRSYAERLRFRPDNDMQVLATGNVEVYERDGKYQFYVSRMVPDGVGELALAFEQLKERLGREGLFDDKHKCSLPSYPRTIGIVTSPTGAVLRDIYTVSKRRMPSVRLVLYPVMVQGAGSAEQIAHGIDFFNKKYPVDVLIVGRGGGSMEDLWSFNEEVVVRSIFKSHIPVISAVGHETDFTLADFVADRRAATPSQAAELAVPDMGDVQQRLRSLENRLQLASVARVKTYRQRVESLMDSYAFTQPLRMLETASVKLDTLQSRLNKIARQQLSDKHNRLLHDIEKLELINPLGVIRRGYGVVHDQRGNIISNIANISIDDVVTVQLNGGHFDALVQNKREE